MTPPTASAARRSSQSRPSAAVRRQAQQRQRRRRWTGGAVAIAVLAVIVAVSLPLAKRAVKEMGLPLQYSSIIRQQAADKHLDPALVAGVIYAETKFDPRTSPAGAEGLMQLEPSTALYLAKKSGATTFTTADLATPSVNIAYGSYYLRYLLDTFNGSTMLTLAAYNAGIGNVEHWVAQARADGHTLTAGEIPFPETREYVQRVLSAQTQYRHRYPRQLGYS